MSALRTILDLFFDWIGGKWAASMSQDHRSDPVYKKNVEYLIARNKAFDKPGD